MQQLPPKLRVIQSSLPFGKKKKTNKNLQPAVGGVWEGFESIFELFPSPFLPAKPGQSAQRRNQLLMRIQRPTTSHAVLAPSRLLCIIRLLQLIDSCRWLLALTSDNSHGLCRDATCRQWTAPGEWRASSIQATPNFCAHVNYHRITCLYAPAIELNATGSVRRSCLSSITELFFMSLRVQSHKNKYCTCMFLVSNNM